jgi:hypothetical protein
VSLRKKRTHGTRVIFSSTLNKSFDGFALTPPPFSLPLPTLPPVLALALRIDKSTSLQYLSLSSRRCANLACSGSEDGRRNAHHHLA